MNFGRKTIYSSVNEINIDNVQAVISDCQIEHEANRSDIIFLREYEKGNQPILSRIKDVRPEINIKVVENHAHQIVNFDLSYVFGSPIRYTQKDGKGESDKEAEDDSCVGKLNEMCLEDNKPSKDQELAKSFLTCGVGYRGAFQNPDKDSYAPFKSVILDPASTYIVYSADIFHRPLCAVTYWTERNRGVAKPDRTHYTVYTDKSVYQFTDLDIGEVKETVNGIGMIPIIEYKQDYERMGCFERVITLLDAINICTSDRINGLAQFVQSFLWFNNVDIDSETFATLKSAGAFTTSSSDGKEPNIKLIESSLNQNEVQTLADYLYSQILQICMIPSREAQSGSTTGQSSMLAGGWQECEENAHRLEQMFEESEREYLKVLKAIIDKSNCDIEGEIKVRDIDIKASRNKISNMLVKTQGLMNMKSFGIHPRIAIQTSDLFSDPQQVYNDSVEYLEQAYSSENGNSSDTDDVKDLQNNHPEGDDPATVKETQNEQTSFLSK